LRVAEALRRVIRQAMIMQERSGRRDMSVYSGNSNDCWMRIEVFLFHLMEMLSTYVVDPLQNVAKRTINESRQRIESAASHAVITASDALDYQFLLLLQE